MGCVGCKDGFYGKTGLSNHDGNNHEAAKLCVNCVEKVSVMGCN